MASFSRGRLVRGLAAGALSVRCLRIDFHADPSRLSAISTKFWHRVDPEHELDAVIGPAIEVLGQREVRIAS